MDKKQLATKLHAGTDLSPAAARQFVAGLDDSSRAKLAAAKTPRDAKRVYEEVAAKRQDAVEAAARDKAALLQAAADSAPASPDAASVEPTESTKAKRGR